MRASILFVCFIFSVGCNNESTTSKSQHYNAPVDYSNDLLRLQIRGNWGSALPDTYAVWKIENDSIYYYQRNESYPYFLKGDTLLVKFPDRDTVSVFGKIKLAGDTLKLYGPDDWSQITYIFKQPD